jgi:hypothetical protein
MICRLEFSEPQGNGTSSRSKTDPAPQHDVFQLAAARDWDPIATGEQSK